jgi:hypothetical protein
MTISKEIEAKILRYHFVDQWRVGTIATQLGIHHSVVRSGPQFLDRRVRSYFPSYQPAFGNLIDS